ncbi:hypothetical protein ACWDUL_20855 [Nocardia niigatensis]
MGKLTRRQERLHAQAMELVNSDHPLAEDEKRFVLDNFQESSTASNGTDGAFFTPAGLAWDLSIQIWDQDRRIIDLAAGIGRLAFSCRDSLTRNQHRPPREFWCVESNPDYVVVGKRILPEAHWICADLLDVPDMGLEPFDVAIGNPPFGPREVSGKLHGYGGNRFEYLAIAAAARVARRGVFIVPRISSPFAYDGDSQVRTTGNAEYETFSRSTGLTFEETTGVRTHLYNTQWHGGSPHVEMVMVDFRPGSKLDEETPQPAAAADQQLLVPRSAIDTAMAQPRRMLESPRADGASQLALWGEQAGTFVMQMGGQAALTSTGRARQGSAVESASTASDLDSPDPIHLSALDTGSAPGL